MIRRLTSLVLFLFCLAAFSARAEDIKKIKIAVPEFISGEGVTDAISLPLVDILKAEFENSGKILTSGALEIQAALEKAGISDSSDSAMESGCQFDEECIQRIGREMRVDYFTYSHISRVSGLFLIEVRLISMSGKTEIPPILKGVQSEGEIADTVRSIGANIAMRIPLEGTILAIVQNGRSVVINLGAVNNLKTNDEFNVMRETVVEGFTDKRNVGTVKVIEIQEERSKAEVKSGRGDIQKGDFIVLKQEELISKLEDERLADEARLAELKQIEAEKRREKKKAKLIRDEARSTQSKFARSASLLRAGYSGFGLVKLGEDSLNDYYDDGFGVMADIFFYRTRTRRGGNGFDFYARYTYRQFGMTGNAYAEFREKHPAVEYGKSSLSIHTFDLGGRLVLGGYFLFARMDLYLIGGVRQAMVIESADNHVRNSYLPTGAVGGCGLEFSFNKWFAFFGEYNYGYTTVGENRDNIDGHQLFFGVSLRTDHI